LTVAPVSATLTDFSTDPNLASDWTQYYFYNAYGRNQVASAWNASNQNLDLTATNEEGLGGLFKTADTRSATDGVTVTYSNYAATTPTHSSQWTCAGLTVSKAATPGIFDDPTGWYGLYFQEEYNADTGATRYRFSAGKGLTELGRITLDSLPSTMKLDIVHDGSAWVFKANGAEVARDSSFTASEMSHYFMYWGSGTDASVSVSADNFGTTVPEPGTLALVGSCMLGLLCYAWRKRR
jgi:hypothetical protein